MMDYWRECIESAFEEAGIQASEKQISVVTDCVDGAHENYGMAHGHECIPNPLAEENRRMEEELKKEKDKVFCRNCNGYGRVIENFGIRSSDTECWICHGEGKHLP